MEEVFTAPIEDMCPILDSGKGVAVQFITDHMYQMMFTYEKWHQYVEHVNKRNNEIKPISAIGVVLPGKGWAFDECRKSIERGRPEMSASLGNE
jgi:hypothetical protein